MPSKDIHDPGYRRLRYCRYADDHLLGFAGPKSEAEEIKRRLGQFLRDELKLELSEEKTLITHARTSAARFLGYEITVQHNDKAITGGQRSSNATVRLRVPAEVIKAKCAPYMQRGKPARRTRMMNMDDYTIVSIYGAEYRGIAQYYLLASDVYRLNRLSWVMETSMLKTLAGKHGSTVSKTAAKHKAKVDTPYGPRTCFEAIVEREGGSHWSRDTAEYRSGSRRRPSSRTASRPGNRSQGTGYQAPREPMRDLRALRERGSASHPEACRPRQVRAGGQARVGGDHGEKAAQVACDLPGLPCQYPRRKASGEKSRISHWRAGCSESGQVRFGGRLPGKGPGSSSMNAGPRRAVHPTLHCLNPNLQKG